MARQPKPAPRLPMPEPGIESKLIWNCRHPADRLFSWIAHDNTLVVCCNNCGEVLKGAAVPTSPPAPTAF